MKKKLLLFLMSLLTLTSYSQVDTVFFNPSDVCHYELKLDTIKYPYLPKQYVQWFVGFNEETEYVADVIPAENIVNIPNEGTYFHIEDIGSAWGFGSEMSARTVSLYYIVSDEEIPSKSHYTNEDLASFTKDTTSVLHIYKDLNLVSGDNELISTYTINGKDKERVYITEGDTVNFSLTAVNPLDIQKYYIYSDDNSEFRDSSVTGIFDVVPMETVKNIKISAVNGTGIYEFETTKAVEVFPEFKIKTIGYELSRENESYLFEIEDDTNIDIAVYNGDSVKLKFTHNSDEVLTTPEVSYSWNKEGKPLSDDIEINGDNIIINEFIKGEMDGVYNCIVTCGDKSITVSFNITSEYPTSNESTIMTDVKILTGKSYLNVLNASGKHVNIFDALGRNHYNDIINNDNMRINLPPGLYIVKIEENIIKLNIR